MRLDAFEIRGFRGYSETRRIEFDDLTTIIGRNDAGKSSLMDALDLYFSDGKLDEDDLCVFGSIAEVTLIAEFSEYPEELTLDATSKTTLKDEHLLYEINGREKLRIVKIFKPKKAAEVFLDVLCPDIGDHDHPIVTKHSDLKKIGMSLGVSDQIPASEKSKNPPWRRAIFAAYAGPTLMPRRVPIAKEDAKAIWDQLKLQLPYFCLFKVDRESSDQDSEARNPLAQAAKIAVAEKQKEIDEIVRSVERRASELVERTLAKLSEMAPDLAVELQPEVAGEPKWEAFKTSLRTDSDVPFNKRGSGTKRLVLLNFFRAEAERLTESNGRRIIYAFEEPESSQHPHNQKLLLDSFKTLSEASCAQVILTTHSPMVAQNLPSESLRLVTKDDLTECPQIQMVSNELNDEGLLENIANNLGILPDKRVKVLVMVEGPNDVEFFKNINAAVLEIDPNVVNLNSTVEVMLVPVGGGTLQQWVARRYLKQLGCIEYHIYDRDSKKNGKYPYEQACEQVNNADDTNSARLTSKREIENYLHSDAISDALDLEVEIDDECDVPQLVSQASKFKAPSMGESSAKRALATRVVKKMNAKRLLERDPDSELVGWFREITLSIK